MIKYKDKNSFFFNIQKFDFLNTGLNYKKLKMGSLFHSPSQTLPFNIQRAIKMMNRKQSDYFHFQLCILSITIFRRNLEQNEVTNQH